MIAPMRDTRRLAVVGVGLIGGSVGLAARRLGGWHVVGYDPTSGASAVERKAVNAMADSIATAVAGADLVVLAVPVRTAVDLVPAIGGGAVVTDVGSTKRSIVEAAGPRFVGSHPMAGGERGGVAHARADLFDGGLCLVTPTPQSDPAAVETVVAFWRSLGMRTLHLSPDDHDRRVADVSHVPHVAAAAVARQADPAAIPLAAGGWRDTTRVAAGNPDLWRDILLDNRDHVTAGLRRMRDDVDRLIGHLDAGDGDAVRAWLAAGAAVKQR
jgi:prephenate dehydrogenase